MVFLPTEKNFVFRRLCNKNKKKCVDFLKKHISFLFYIIFVFLSTDETYLHTVPVKKPVIMPETISTGT